MTFLRTVKATQKSLGGPLLGAGVAARQRWIAALAGAASGNYLGWRGFWVFQLVFWSVIALALFVLLRLFANEGNATLIVAGRVGTGALVTTALFLGYRHRLIRRLPSGSMFCCIVGLNLIVPALSSGIWLQLVGLGFPEIPTKALPFNLFIARVCSLAAWNFAYFGTELVLSYHHRQVEAFEVREAARAAELKQLQAQLNPHFLFNALNVVIASLEEKHSKTREIIENLADYLRFSLQEARPLEPLGREFDALESYLELQRARFQEGIECEIVSTSAARRVWVPPMLVQPLLENAFKYGPLSSEVPMHVGVDARVSEGWLEIKVSNTGDWVDTDSTTSLGSGLASIRRRLALLISEAATVEIEKMPQRVCVSIRMPVSRRVQ